MKGGKSAEEGQNVSMSRIGKRKKGEKRNEKKETWNEGLLKYYFLCIIIIYFIILDARIRGYYSTNSLLKNSTITGG